MEKKNILFLILILLLATALRIWNFDSTNIDTAVFTFEFSKDVFKTLFSNSLACIHYFVNYLFTFAKNIQPYASVIFDILSIIVLYFLGMEFDDKKNKELSGLLTASFGAISVFLISFSKVNSMFSLTFLLSVLTLFISLKLLNTQNKKYYWFLGIFSLLLFFTFNLSIFFILFNFVAIFSFYVRKKKSFFTTILTLTGFLILLFPLIPFVLNIVNVPDYLKEYSLPFNFNHVVIYFINMFSPKLSIDSFLDFNNIGFWIFVLIPSIIGLFLTFKGSFNKRNINIYCASLFVSTFLSMLIVCICAKEIFLSKYLITIYPILLILMADGVNSLKNKDIKIILPTIFLTITVFYIVAKNLISTSLF